MKEKVRYILFPIINAFIIAGIIIWFIGLYYFMIKAGIPYQDPPLELRIQYEVDARIGNILMGSGFSIAVFSGVIRFVLHLIWKKFQNK
jgi:type IV secretory pathway TrbD component